MAEIFSVTNTDHNKINGEIFGKPRKIQPIFQNASPNHNQTIFGSFLAEEEDKNSNNITFGSKYCEACHGKSKTHIKNCLNTGINWCSFCDGCVLNHLKECPESKHFTAQYNDKKININFETSATLKKQDDPHGAKIQWLDLQSNVSRPTWQSSIAGSVPF